MEDMLKAEGWTHQEHEGLIRHLGGLWHRQTDEGIATGFIAQEFHVNRNGVAHGGMMMTVIDRAFGITARSIAQIKTSATISLSHQFMSPLQIGSFAWVLPRVSRATKRIVFMEGHLICEDAPVLQAQGIWRIVRAE